MATMPNTTVSTINDVGFIGTYTLSLHDALPILGGSKIQPLPHWTVLSGAQVRVGGVVSKMYTDCVQMVLPAPQQLVAIQAWCNSAPQISSAIVDVTAAPSWESTRLLQQKSCRTI